MADRLRDKESVRRLYRKLRRGMHARFGEDISTYNLAWKRLVCERLATYGPSDGGAVEAAEGDLAVAMGLVYLRGLYAVSKNPGAPPSAYPSLVNIELIERWYDFAREHSYHHPDLDPITWDMLASNGYQFFRRKDDE